MWGFAEMLPPVPESSRVTLGEGATPYVPVPRIARALGAARVDAKLEGSNPTGAFKDRVASLGVSLSRKWGYDGVFTASSGNAGSAIAAYCGRAGLPCVILAPERTSVAKWSQTLLYGARVVRVRHLYDSPASLAKALGIAASALPSFRNLFVWSPWNPLLPDALKTIAYEIALQGPLPEWVLVPVAGGDLLSGIHKGFVELRDAGVTERVPRMVAVQGVGADPVVRAIQEGAAHVPTLDSAQTVAGALVVRFGVDNVLVAIRESGGTAVSVPDVEILDAQRWIAAEEGIFCEISSATVVAALRALRSAGTVPPESTVGLVLTGTGFKEFRAVPAESATVSEPVELSGLGEALHRFAGV